MRRSLLALAALALVPAALRAQAPTTADSAAIRRAALDYAQSWYAGDSAQMRRALHAGLAKRIVRPEPGAPGALDEMTADELVAAAGRGHGKGTPAANRRADVRILDVFEGIASVRTDMHGWVDYMQLARVDGQWRIVNVLWAMRPRGQTAGR